VQSSPDRSAGARVEVGLDTALPFAVEVRSNHVILTIADAPGALLGDDPRGKTRARQLVPAQPVVFDGNGDILRLDKGSVIALSTTLALESDAALSPNRDRVAFCRSAPDALPEQGALWVSDIDGRNERLVADVGGCVDPAWSVDGRTLVFAAPWSSAPPLSFRLWQVRASGGEPEAVSGLDEWSRREPHVLPSGGIVSIGSADGGRGALLRDDGTTSTALGAAALSGYRSVGSAVVSLDGTSIAVEAIRADGGADVLVLDEQGAEQSRISGQWWVRPLAWGTDGTLYYLSVTCRNGLVLAYELHSLNGAKDTTLAKGGSLGDIGAAVATDDGLLYVRSVLGGADPRGPRPALSAPSEIWLLEPQSGARSRLLSAANGINTLQ
jgi:dipeptidyl aminopeptidase/acylaminoacyl peptidase